MSLGPGNRSLQVGCLLIGGLWLGPLFPIVAFFAKFFRETKPRASTPIPNSRICLLPLSLFKGAFRTRPSRYV